MGRFSSNSYGTSKGTTDRIQRIIGENSYKSANNRAFYAIEKCVKALLATEQVEVLTHNGAMKMFNMKLFIAGMETLLLKIIERLQRQNRFVMLPIMMTFILF